MGSLRIAASLYLDSDGRYTQLFENGKWKNSSQESDVQPFIDAFDSYAAGHLGVAKPSYQESLKALRLMMNWKNTQLPHWNQRVRAAGSEGKQLQNGVDPQFTDRAILLNPAEVVKQ